MISDKFKTFLSESKESSMSLREAKRICENAGLKVSKPVDEEKSYALKEAKRICENAGLKVSKKVPENIYEAKGVNTNTRAFQTKVQQTIKDNFEDDDWIDNLKSVIEGLTGRRNPTLYQAAYKYAEEGNVDAYYSQVQKTMAEWFECSEDEIDEYYKGNNSRMYDVYCHFCAKAIVSIITGVKCYVK